MEHKMRKQETAEAMGRGKESLTRKNFSKRRGRGGMAKKAMAYFLSFLMLAGNLQSVSYAEEIAGETVERIALATEEKSSESLREEEKKTVLSSEEKTEEGKTSMEETALEKEESESEGKKVDLTSEEENKTVPSEAKTEELSLEEKDSLSSEEAK